MQLLFDSCLKALFMFRLRENSVNQQKLLKVGTLFLLNFPLFGKLSILLWVR